MSMNSNRFRHALLGASAMVSAAAVASVAYAADTRAYDFDMPAQPLTLALKTFGATADQQLIFSESLVRDRTAPALKGSYTPDQALAMLLNGTGLIADKTPGGVVTIRSAAADPQSGSAADGADGTVQALIVTAQKREENIQDVPIAMSAFTQEDLTRSQVATGADLMTQVPNMTFTKTNFTSYSIQLRGIGTQAISATVDPAVAVAFNNTPFLRAHFFEQEFFDMERVEVLRGPQGTLYGRNATAGVVNLISAKPKFHFEAKASADVANYSSTRLEGMLNLPLVEDKAALRLAGAWTKRDGFVTNALTGKQIDGRDLWSTRVSLRVDPTEKLRANFVWEHFEENDDRLRSGKQTCQKAHSPTSVLGVPVLEQNNGVLSDVRYLNQGCDPASIYSPDAYQTPDGQTLPYFLPLAELGGPISQDMLGNDFDVYVNSRQSQDLRIIESQYDPQYKADADTVEVNVDYDLTPNLTLTSQTGYNRDFIFSTEDYNRFATKGNALHYCDPLVSAFCSSLLQPGPTVYGWGKGPELMGQPCDLQGSDGDGGCYTTAIICDPQIGCNDRLMAVDLATERSRQFSQEFRVTSDFDGRFNFSLGGNYLRYKTLEDYYVFINTITAAVSANRPLLPGPHDNHLCLQHGFDYTQPGTPLSPYGALSVGQCTYIDLNPISDLNGQGHNYFRNQNPYKLQSYAIFGEAYYDLTPELKLTAGLRWTVDKKHFDSIPSEILVPGYGYPMLSHTDQEWREPTGRLVLNWKPDLSFTDETMVYASYTHGYKAGGANPPGAVLLVMRGGDVAVPTHPATFDPEFVDAYEIGTKDTLLDGRLTTNFAAFYYDYTSYQISEIVDRSAINLNFDAKIWGVELETDWRPLDNLRFGAKVGYENTRVGDGQSAVDLMNRTGGHADWMVVKPFPTQASNCILPTYVVAALLAQNNQTFGGLENACTSAYLDNVDPITGLDYQQDPTIDRNGDLVPAGYPGFNPDTAPNRGAGFVTDLSGHMLPNAPHWTGTLTADYTIPLPSNWLMTLHTDLYYQSEAWTRIFNLEGFDKLKAYTNVNLAAIFSNEDAGWTVMAYVKNVFDKDNITGAFLNSDDTGLTNNVFLNEPRLYGIRVTKNWSDSPWWSAHANKSGWYPMRVELEGYHGAMERNDSTYQPGLAMLFDPGLAFPTGIQNDLGAGNGGGVRFTYQPTATSWNVSAAVRYGRANGGTLRHKRIPVANQMCFVPGLGCRYPGSVAGTVETANTKYGWASYYDAQSSNEETHAFADFTVGRDFGLGQMGRSALKSTLSAGIGYGRLKATSEATMHGSPDVYFPQYFFDAYGVHYIHMDRFNDTARAARTFEGAGPEVNWDASLRLSGNRNGELDLEAGLGGVVLFGKQRAEISGNLEGLELYGTPLLPTGYSNTLYNEPLDIPARSKSATVPGLRANLGLSYSTGGLKLSGGYKWERYYNAIDGGVNERDEQDRQFDGPYMKVSIGFGG